MWILIFLFINRAFKALSDILKSSFGLSIFNRIRNTRFREWCNPNKSWWFKWEKVNGKQVVQTKKLWYYLWIFTPKYVENFPYSSTWLVKYTDLWHTSEFIRRAMIVLILVFMTLSSYGYINNSYIIPYLIWFYELNILSLVANTVIIGTSVQLIGFTVFYDYILRMKFWNKILK